MRNFSILTVMLALTACARSDYDNFKKDLSPTAHREAETAKAHRG